MKNPYYFPTTEQFKRDREAKARTRRAVGHAWLRGGQAPSAISNRPSAIPQATEPPEPTHIIAATIICTTCGKIICSGSPGTAPLYSVCTTCSARPSHSSHTSHHSH